MSHKQAKRLRQQQRMEKKQEQYSLQHLEYYIAYSVTVTGEKPKVLTLTEPFYNWYIQEAQRHAETLGLKPGFANDVPMFAGIKVEKKTNIITPASVLPKN